MGKPSLASSSDLWESAEWLADDLFEDEAVLWAGRPRSSRSAVIGEVPTVFFGLGLLALGLVIMAGILSHWPESAEPGVTLPLHQRVLIVACIGVWLVPAALLMIARPLFALRRMAHSYYTLTTMRAIIVEPDSLGRPQARSYWPPHLRLTQRIDRLDGTSDLVFATASPGSFWRNFGFLGIDQAIRVQLLIRDEVLARLPPAEDGP